MSSASPVSVGPTVFQTLARRTVISIAAILIGLVPVVIFGLLSGQWVAASWAVWGMLTGLVNLVLGGRPVAYLSMGLLIVLTPVAIVSGAVPLAGAGLMAIMCFGVGLSAARGLNRGMLLIPLFMACMIIAPPTWSGQLVSRGTTSYLLWMMLIFGGGAFWAILVFPPLLRKRKFAPPEPNARIDTLVYTILITVLCTASTLVVLVWFPGSKGAWLVVTVLVISQVGHNDTVKRTVARVAGTVAGVGIAAIVASLSNTEAVLLSIGFVLLVIALIVRQGPHYGVYMALMTPTVVLFSSTSIANVPATDAERLAFTLIAATLVLLSSAIAVAWTHYQQTQTPAPTRVPVAAAT